jgi:hypothetical protein
VNFSEDLQAGQTHCDARIRACAGIVDYDYDDFLAKCDKNGNVGARLPFPCRHYHAEAAPVFAKAGLEWATPLVLT